MKHQAQRIITAMRISGVTSLSEGNIYEWLLKGYGLHADDATMVVKEMLDSGKVIRNGCALFLTEYADNDDKKAAFGQRTLHVS